MLSLGGSPYDPTDPVGLLLLNVAGMLAEFEADLLRMRPREGTAVAKARHATDFRSTILPLRASHGDRSEQLSGQ